MNTHLDHIVYVSLFKRFFSSFNKMIVYYLFIYLLFVSTIKNTHTVLIHFRLYDRVNMESLIAINFIIEINLFRCNVCNWM